MNTRPQHKLAICLFVVTTMTVLTPVRASVRIKDITVVEGLRRNQLTGMGLVTGLNGTGGKSPVTRQFALNMLQNFGQRANPSQRLTIPDDTKQRTDNLSVVTVTATLPVNARRGTTIDVTVSAFDDANSLQGGTLMTTPLFGVDNVVYASAAGPVTVGGFSFDGNAANVQKNHPTSGLVSSGGIVEEEVCWNVACTGQIRLLLRDPDFQTANRINQRINEAFPGVSHTVDAGTVEVLIPSKYRLNHVGFIAAARALRVEPDTVARVVINERTGTVVVGQRVRISKVAITHANLAVITSESPEVSQPAPFSEGVTAVAPRTDLNVVEEKRPMQVFDRPTTVGDLAGALNALGVTPRDLSAIFQELAASGALHAELIFR